MSFQPIIGGGGYAGWKLLARTGEIQKKLVAQDAEVVRDTRHFRENFDDIKTAEDLVSDYRMLRTALSAYGLEADTNNRYFIRKVLESELDDPKSLANRLGDKRYRALAEAFGMGKGGARAKGLGDTVAERHLVAELERRVGNVDGNLRLAMNAKRELAAVGESDSSDTTRWYNILGSVPLRKVVEGALGLGTEFGKLPVERQAQELASRTAKLLGSGSPSVFADPKNLEKLIGRFLVRAEAVTSSQSAYNAALVLLR